MTKKVSTAKTMEEKLIAQQQKVDKLTSDLAKAKAKLQAYTKAVNEEKEEKLRNLIANSDLSIDEAVKILAGYIESQKNGKHEIATVANNKDAKNATAAILENINEDSNEDSENATTAMESLNYIDKLEMDLL